MTQQVINLGTGPNTGTGDPIRTAFAKLNANFTELYGAGFAPFTPTTPGYVPASGGGTVNFLRADGTWTTVNQFTAVLAGIVPASGGGTANFLRADGAWAAPPQPSSPLLTARCRMISSSLSRGTTRACVRAEVRLPLGATTS